MNASLYICFSHEIGFCERPIGVFQQLSCTHAFFCPNRHTPLIPRTRAVAIFLSAVLQTYAQPLCLPFSLLETFITYLTQSGPLCFFLSNESATSKLSDKRLSNTGLNGRPPSSLGCGNEASFEPHPSSAFFACDRSRNCFRNTQLLAVLKSSTLLYSPIANRTLVG